MKKRLYPYEARALNKTIAHGIGYATPVLLLVLYAVWAAFQETWALFLLLIPFGLGVIALYLVMFVPGWRRDYPRRAYKLVKRIRKMPAEDREELNQEMLEGSFFSVGELCFFNKYVYFKNSHYLIPYVDLEDCLCEDKEIPTKERPVYRCDVIFIIYDKRGDDVLYPVTMNEVEYPHRVALVERISALLAERAPHINFVYNIKLPTDL